MKKHWVNYFAFILETILIGKSLGVNHSQPAVELIKNDTKNF